MLLMPDLPAPAIVADGLNWHTILPGAIVALLAFALATARDEFKAYRQERKRSASILRASRLEVETLIALVENNQQLTRRDLQAQQQGQQVPNPIAIPS